jgi:hypothetical protein
MNIVWLVPAAGALVAAAEAKPFKDFASTSFGANMSFDVGGMLSYAASDDTPSGELVFMVQLAMNFFYLGLCWETEELLRKGK